MGVIAVPEPTAWSSTTATDWSVDSGSTETLEWCELVFEFVDIEGTRD